MALVTHTKRAEAFKHIVNVVFQIPKEGPLYKALEKSRDNDVIAMITLCDCDIDSLTYDRSDTEKDLPLSRGDRNLLCIFCHYVLYCHSIGSPIEYDWLSITSKDFDKFWISPHCPTIVRGSAPLPTAVSTTQSV